MAPRDVSTVTTLAGSPTASASAAAKSPAPPYKSHAVIPGRAGPPGDQLAVDPAASRCACQNAVTGTRQIRSPTRCTAL